MPRLSNVRGLKKEVTVLEQLAKQAAYIKKHKAVIELQAKIKKMSDEELEECLRTGNYPKFPLDKNHPDYYLSQLNEDELHQVLSQLSEEELVNGFMEALNYS